MPAVFGIKQRWLAIWVYALVAWVGAWLLAWLPNLLLAPYRVQRFTPLGWALLQSGLEVLVVAWSLPFVLLIWRRADEYMRERSKFAWYWGGTLGLMASVPVYMFILMGGLRWVWPALFHWGLAPAHALMIGFSVPVGIQFFGFIAAAVWWRLARR
jgi:hypothetical protein